MCGVLFAAVILAVFVPLGRRGRSVLASQVLVSALTWLVVNRSFEGRILAEPFPGNGLTLADLLALPSAVVTVLLVAATRGSDPTCGSCARRRSRGEPGR